MVKSMPWISKGIIISISIHNNVIANSTTTQIKYFFSYIIGNYSI